MQPEDWTVVSGLSGGAAALANVVLAWFTRRSVQASEKQIEHAAAQVRLARQMARDAAVQLQLVQDEYSLKTKELTQAKEPRLHVYVKRDEGKFYAMLMNIGSVPIVPEYFDLTLLDSESGEMKKWNYSSTVRGHESFQKILLPLTEIVLFEFSREISFVDLSARGMRIAQFFKTIAEGAAMQHVLFADVLPPAMDVANIKIQAWRLPPQS